MATYQRGKYWWYRFRFAGERIDKPTKSTSRTVAKDAERQHRKTLEAGVIYWRMHSVAAPAQLADSTPVAASIDLSQVGTTRGTDTSTIPVGLLPRRVVTAHIVLPNFSPGGDYLVSVATDRSSDSAKATGRALANLQGFHTDLTVTLDLRSLPPGTYFLATTHEGDPASYSYPLSVR
ncbi:MAG: hypothetical protein ACLQHT_22345 [Terracidiphilus sp.]